MSSSQVISIDELKNYFIGVVDRAGHHAQNVNSIIYTLLGIIVLKKDNGSDIKVRGNNQGKTGNILWVFINSQRYALCYNHVIGKIEIRLHSFKGQTLLLADNATSAQAILNIFP